MKRVKPMRLKNGLTVGALVSEMNACGVLGAGKVGKAAEIVKEMFSDSDYTVFLTLAGPLVPGGLRRIIRDLIEQEYVNVVVTTTASAYKISRIVHIHAVEKAAIGVTAS